MRHFFTVTAFALLATLAIAQIHYTGGEAPVPNTSGSSLSDESQQAYQGKMGEQGGVPATTGHPYTPNVHADEKGAQAVTAGSKLVAGSGSSESVSTAATESSSESTPEESNKTMGVLFLAVGGALVLFWILAWRRTT